MKNDRIECRRCLGKGYHWEKIKNLGTLDRENHIVTCLICDKGYITNESRNRYLHSMGVAPCPKI